MTQNSKICKIFLPVKNFFSAAFSCFFVEPRQLYGVHKAVWPSFGVCVLMEREQHAPVDHLSFSNAIRGWRLEKVESKQQLGKKPCLGYQSLKSVSSFNRTVCIMTQRPQRTDNVFRMFRRTSRSRSSITTIMFWKHAIHSQVKLLQGLNSQYFWIFFSQIMFKNSLKNLIDLFSTDPESCSVYKTISRAFYTVDS